MNISFFTLLMTALWSSIFVLVLYFCGKNTKLISCIGVWPLSALSLGVICRCVFPIEILSFTKTLSSDGFFAGISKFFISPISKSVSITPMMILAVVWGIGFAVLASRFIICYCQYIKKVQAYEQTDNETITAAAKRIAQELHVRLPRVVEISSARVPMVVGFLQPNILLPRCNYSEKDYEYILTHELIHWRNHDLWIKLLVELLCAVFWWNPLVYLLKSSLAQTLEIKCDLAVTNGKGEAEKKDYLRVIEKTILSNPTREEQCALPYTVSEFVSAGAASTLQRADILMEYKRNPLLEKIVISSVIVVMAAVLVLSYAFVVQPYYEAPVDEIINDGYTETTPENAYIIEEPDGSFWLYVNKKMTKRLDSDVATMMIGSGFTLKNPEE